MARERGDIVEVELEVPAVADPARRDAHVADVTARVVGALAESDVLLFTSRTLVRDIDPAASLEISRRVSTAVIEVVRGAVAAEPAWVVAKGGITSHDVAVRGLGIKRATVLGQLLPGLVSVFQPVEALPQIVGTPYVVFAGNVGDENTLVYVIDLFSGRTARDPKGRHRDPERRGDTSGMDRPRRDGLPHGGVRGPRGVRRQCLRHQPGAGRGADHRRGEAGGVDQRGGERADVLVVMVATPDQVESVLLGDDPAAAALTAGAAVVVMATVGPAPVKRWAERLGSQQVDLVDAPVSGGAARAAAGDLLIMVGGTQSAVDRAQPLLDAMARSAPHVGTAPGDGQKVKLVNQLLCGVHIAAAAEALALAEAMQLDPGATWEVLRGGAAASFMLDDRGARMVHGTDEVKSALDIFVKDMGLVTDAARASSYPAPLASAAEQLYLAGRRAGLGRRDDSAVIEVLRGTL